MCSFLAFNPNQRSIDLFGILFEKAILLQDALTLTVMHKILLQTDVQYSAPLRATRGHTQAYPEDAKLWRAKEGEGE